jgi:hypothetical protein
MAHDRENSMSDTNDAGVWSAIDPMLGDERAVFSAARVRALLSAREHSLRESVANSILEARICSPE